MKQLGYIHLIIYALLHALIAVFIRHIHDMDIQTIVFVRALLAVLFIAGVVVARREWKALKLTNLLNTLMVGVFHSGMMFLYTGALMKTSVANTTMLTYMAPCFSLLFAKYYFKQNIPVSTLGNLTFSLFGLILVAGPQDLSLNSQEMLGNLMALGAGFAYAVMMVWSRPLSKQVTETYIVFWQHVVIAIVVLPFVSINTGALLVTNALPLAGLGFLCSGLAFLLFMSGLRLVPTHHALIMTSLEPVASIGVAALFLQESLTLGTVIGAGLIVFGAYRITVATSKSAAPLKPVAKFNAGQLTLRSGQSQFRSGQSQYRAVRVAAAATSTGYKITNQSPAISSPMLRSQHSPTALIGGDENEQTNVRWMPKWLCQEFQKRDARLLPIRLFLGLGWLRAGIEKLIDPGWHSGEELQAYLQAQMADGNVVFPFYQSLMSGLFEPYAYILGPIIMAGEFYVGLAIIFGILTRPALFAGLFMAVNFILAGSVNPAAFYVMMQALLVSSNVGEVFGLDSMFTHERIRAEIERRRKPAAVRWKLGLFMGGGLACGLSSLVVLPYVQAIDPVHSIEDPAMLLGILLGLQGMLLLINGTGLSFRKFWQGTA